MLHICVECVVLGFFVFLDIFSENLSDTSGMKAEA